MADKSETLEEPLIDQPIDNDHDPDFKIKAAKATVDLLFLRRWARLMKYSGTFFVSWPHLLMWLGFLFGFGAAFFEVTGLNWNAQMMGTVSGLAPVSCTNVTNIEFNCKTSTVAEGWSKYSNKPGFSDIWEQFSSGVLIFLGMGLCNAGSNFIRLTLWWFWRKNITTKITQKYLRGTNPFAVVYLKDYALDNPDQRIVQDIDGIAELSAKIFSMGIGQIGMMIFSSNLLYNLIGFKSILTAWGMAIGFSFFYYLLITPISRFVFKLDHKEGDFRYAHARIREFAESIAFFEGEQMEKVNSEKAFSNVISASFLVAKWTSLFTVYSLLNIFLPYYILVVVNANFIWKDGFVPTSRIGPTLVASSSLASAIMGSVSIFLSLSGDMGKLAGFVGRVAQLQELFYFLNSHPEQRQPEYDHTNNTLEFHKVSCKSPQKTTLVTNLNMKVEEGKSVLILGPSGCGKSSLLRALVGLWHCDGVVHKPKIIGTGGMFYLPQKPYFRHGSLKDQLIYPDEDTTADDKTLFKCLEMANIEYIHAQRGGWNAVHRWSELLSPGEQQRLVFARLFYHQPKFAILDESTSALDSKNERLMYETCVKLGITYMSVGHRVTLFQYHQVALKFDGKGGYSLADIKVPDAADDEASSWTETENHPGTISLSSPTADQNQLTSQQQAEKALKQGYVRRFFYIWKLAHPEFFSIHTLILIGLIVFGLGSAIMFAYSPLIVGNVSRVVTGRLEDEFPGVAVYIIVFHGAMSLLMAVSRACAMFLGVYYRKSITERIHKDYFNAYTILNLNTVRREIDNVDQRIASDVGLGSSGFIEVLGGTGIAAGAPVIGSTVGNGIPALLYFVIFNVIGVFIQLVFVVSPPSLTPITVVRPPAWISLGIIIGIIVVIGIVSIIFTQFIAKFTMLKSKAEGDFRHAHVHVREYAESIGFHGRLGVTVERKILNHFFDKVLLAWRRLLVPTVLFGLAREILMSLAYPFAVMTVVIYFQTNPEVADTYSTSQLFSGVNSMIRTARYTIGYGTIMVGIFSLIGANQGLTLRIATLLEALEDIKNDPRNKKNKKDDDENVTISESDDGHDSAQGKREIGEEIAFKGVSCVTPTGRILNSTGVTVTVKQGDRLLLMGPSGCGKSSLLRVLAGLWLHKDGTVTYPGKENILFLPQKAYMVIGTFRDQVIYPENFGPNTPPDSELEKYVKIANLEYLLKRFKWDDVEIWNAVLSPGEQQRLSFARLFYHAPKFTVLDESTSALDPYNEDEMYNMCIKLGIGVVSVGHRESIITHHNLILKFDGKGGWNLNKKGSSSNARKMTLAQVARTRQSISTHADSADKIAAKAADEYIKRQTVKIEPLVEEAEDASARDSDSDESY